MRRFAVTTLSAALLLGVAASWSVAAPAPEGLVELATFKTECPSFSVPLLSSDSRTLFATDAFGVIRLWDTASGKQVAALKYIPERCGDFTIPFLSPDGQTLACVYYNKPSGSGVDGSRIVLWDVAEGKRLGILQEEQKVEQIVFSPDSKVLSAVVRNLGPLPRPLRAPIPDPEPLQVWDVAKRKKLRSCKAPSLFQSISIPPGCKRPVLASLGSDRGEPPALFKLTDPFTGKCVFACPLPADREARFTLFSFALDHSETKVAATGLSPLVNLWDIKTGKNIASLRLPPQMAGGRLVFAPGDKVLAVCYRSVGPSPIGGFILYEVNSGKILKREESGNSNLTFSPDGRLLASTRSGGFVIHEVPSGKVLAERSIRFFSPSFLLFSPDGRLLVTADNHHNEIKLWGVPRRWRADR